jgi:hypothetical protein
MMILHKPSELRFHIQKVIEDKFQAILKQESETPSILELSVH